MEEQNVKQKKLSYEELKNAAMQLQQRCMMLEGKLQGIEIASVRLNYLFKIIKFKESFSGDFVSKCISEIENILTVDNENPPTDIGDKEPKV